MEGLPYWSTVPSIKPIYFKDFFLYLFQMDLSLFSLLDALYLNFLPEPFKTAYKMLRTEEINQVTKAAIDPKSKLKDMINVLNLVDSPECFKNLVAPTDIHIWLDVVWIWVNGGQFTNTRQRRAQYNGRWAFGDNEHIGKHNSLVAIQKAYFNNR